MARASSPCPTCPAIIPPGTGPRCPACTTTARKASRQRNGRDDGHYASTKWRRLRHQLLPPGATCQTPDCDRRATVLDHEPPRRQLIAAGIPDPDHPAFLHPLCAPCHNRKTATEDGGFGTNAVDRSVTATIEALGLNHAKR